MTRDELKARCKDTISWLDTKGFKRIVDEDREILEFLLSEVLLDPRPEARMLGAKGCYLNGYKRGYEDAKEEKMKDKEGLLLTEKELHEFGFWSEVEVFGKVAQAQLSKLLKAGYVKLAKDQSLPPALYERESVEGCTEEAVKQDMLREGWRKVEL